MAWGSDTAATQLTSVTTEQFFNQVPTAIVIAALFITCNLILTWIAHLLQRRLTGEQRNTVARMPIGTNTGEDATRM